MFFQNVIEEFIAISKESIGEQLTGIYLHGSMAMGCFNPEKSDIDLFLVLEKDVTDIQKMEFMKQVVRLNAQAPTKGLELSLVKREYCKPFVYPTPFELHFSPMHLKWFQDNPVHYIEAMKGEDKDLAAHVTVINNYGIVLYGEPIETVFGEVSKKDYVESIWFDVQGAREEMADNPMYITLNLCRVLAFLKEGICLSKQQGGEWGILHMPEKYHPLLLQALSCYKGKESMQMDQNASQFADEILTLIELEKELVT